MEMSAISTNSRSRIRFTGFGGSEAVGLNGPRDWMGESRLGRVGMLPVAAADVAAASMSNPELPGLALKIGSLVGADSSDSV